MPLGAIGVISTALWSRLHLIGSVVGRDIEHSPVSGNSSQPTVDLPAEETKLGHRMATVHVEGSAGWLPRSDGSPPVGHNHQTLDVVAVLARDLNDELAIKKFDLMALATLVSCN